MKVNEILVETGSDADHYRDMRNALSDVAMQELQKLEDNPMEYFAQHGVQVPPEQAQQFGQMLASVDDRTYDLIASSRAIVSSIEQNYNEEMDSSFISPEALQEVMAKVQARQR